MESKDTSAASADVPKLEGESVLEVNRNAEDGRNIEGSKTDTKQEEQGLDQEQPKADSIQSSSSHHNVETKKQTQPDQQKSNTKPNTKSVPVCRMYHSKKGCFHGSKCKFRHIPSTSKKTQEGITKNEDLDSGLSSQTTKQSVPTRDGDEGSSLPIPAADKGKQRKEDDEPTANEGIRSSATAQTSIDTPSKQPQPNVDSSKTVPRPTARQEHQDPKGFQIMQIKRRFQAKESKGHDQEVLLDFKMAPSDPDFPFDISGLECTLKIPQLFPYKKPTLRVSNKEMERGFQVNVERGFDAIWDQAKTPTLLNAMKLLDKELEKILTAQKTEIVKIVTNATPNPSLPTATSSAEPLRAKEEGVKIAPPVTQDHREQKKTKRQTETSMLERRLGGASGYSREADGTIYVLPIEPRKRDALPPSLQGVKSIRLFVPLEYDEEPCTIELMDVEGEAAENVTNMFLKRVKETPNFTLLAHVNYLAQMMHLMAKQKVEQPSKKTEATVPSQIKIPHHSKEVDDPQASGHSSPSIRDTEKDHVKIIPRPPPEWIRGPDNGDEESESEENSYKSDLGDVSEEGSAEDGQGEAPTRNTPQEKGILLSLPGLELIGIELLELVLVNLVIKCERCKDTMEVQKVKPHDSTESDTQSAVVFTSCKKCAASFSVGFRKDIMHINSFRAGYLDLEGCTVVDLMPSTFIPTCSDCSTTVSSSAGIVSVRGETSMGICRICHRKMSFKIPEVKFLFVGSSALSHLPLKPAARRKKETLGIVAGTELPNRGRCTHYSKSYRWFRFSCCNKVYPCDRCHDAANPDHPNEFANRMICGWCSREQNYRPEDCGMSSCRKGITGRTGTGFWEGGKGTRDPKRMSRKDPRKYKRRGGGAVGSKYK